jgi:hypothetical protein
MDAMAVGRKLHDEVAELRRDVTFLKHALSEEYELSPAARKALAKARKTPESAYVDLR